MFTGMYWSKGLEECHVLTFTEAIFNALACNSWGWDHCRSATLENLAAY